MASFDGTSKNYKKNETTSPIFKGLELPKSKKKPMIIMFDFKISMTIKKGGKRHAIKEYNGKPLTVWQDFRK